LNSQGSQVLLPRHGSAQELRHRLKAVHREVRGDPALLRVSEARRGMGESILSALGLAIGSASRARPHGYSAAARTRVARQVEAYLVSNSQESLYLADLCSVAGVGERTLRYIFQERYGMSPVRYLKLRRLHQVRRALRRADPDFNTVQSVANRCGIWHLGRFASEYRALFNESPLETLKKTQTLGGLGRISPVAPRHGPYDSSVPGLG
jgi:AraC family ethanolamine operon transcriptional activator